MDNYYKKKYYKYKRKYLDLRSRYQPFNENDIGKSHFLKMKYLDLKLNEECDIEDVAVEDIHHFLNSFAENAKMNLHLHVLYGEDQHHKVEAAFKALARAIKEAIKVVGSEIPSTKGVL